MEYMENGSLDELLDEQGTLPPEDAAEMFRDVAVGLTHAHGKGVLHCDLKPANILLDQDQRPRLADFGQSRLSDEQTPALGTLYYMAPEQADLNAVPDARWDVYALGALLYCMLTGRPPHRSDQSIKRIESAADLAKRLERYRKEIADAPPPNQHRQTPGVDGELADIIDRCLAIDSDDRYSNPQLVLDALDARQQHRARRPLLVTGLVGPLLLLLVMTVFFWHGFRSSVNHSKNMVNEQTFRSNEFAAKFVAKSFEAEIAQYFEIVENEASRPDFHAELRKTFESELLQSLSNPQTDDGRIETLRGQFLTEPQRQRLKSYLQGRLASFNENPQPDAPRFSSIIALDRWGTIVAVAYDQKDTKTRSVGGNYSWRTYFYGGPEDRERARPRKLPAHIEAPHLSAVFKSTTTANWKVAISAPVYEVSGTGREFLGVVAFTVAVGDFAVFRSKRETTDYFAVLIDNREGERKGTILQHPLFKVMPPARDYKVAETQLTKMRSEPEYKYHDPLADAPGGEAYGGEWIAATEPVRLPNRAAKHASNGNHTDLVVLVQVSAAAATKPVYQLGRRLATDGVLALGVVVLVIVVLWLVVLRALRVTTRTRGHRSTPHSEPTPFHNMPTIRAKGRRVE
jgi:serine/threonine protein kinase